MTSLCGILGVVGDVKFNEFKTALETIKHRGPDRTKVSGVDFRNQILGLSFSEEWKNFKLVFGHNRLSILDLSEKGDQPMVENGYMIVHNGEIYNYVEIRSELEKKGWRFVSNTDTEVVLKAYIEYGLDAFKIFNGMWANVIWDPVKERLVLSRDRYGIKPLYYFFDGKRFAFASEIKALLKLGFVKRDIDMDMVRYYLIWGAQEYLPQTLFTHIKRLLPSHILVLDLKTMRLDSIKYYDIEINDRDQRCDLKTINYFSEKILNLLMDSVERRLISDVRVGTSLSGGVDSSSVVYAINHVMKNHNIKSIGERLLTFSSVYKNFRDIDETKWINIIASDTGATSIKIEPKYEDFVNDLPKLVYHQDEPFDTTSVFAQWSVMKLPRGHGVIVTLDGQGPDEIFGGYLGYIPIFISQLIKEGRFLKLIVELSNIRKISNFSMLKLLKSLLYSIAPKITSNFIARKLSEDLFKVKPDISNLYYKGNLRSHLNNLNLALKFSVYEGLTELLRYADRNSMAFSIESRFPWLDHRLVDLAFSIPADCKIYKGWTKYIERMAVEKMINKKIAWRRDKLGFPTPEKSWISKLFKEGTTNDQINSSKILKELKIKPDAVENPKFSWKLISLSMWESVFEI